MMGWPFTSAANGSSGVEVGGTAVGGGSGWAVEVLWGAGVTLGGVDGVGVVVHAINAKSNGSPVSTLIRFDVIHASFEDRSAMALSI
jgi:hypothetical protein